MGLVGPSAGQKKFSIAPSGGQEQGVKCELDQRHAERIISKLGLESCMPVSAPCVQESVSSTKSMLIESTKMDDTEARRLRALAARLNYLEADRPDLLFLSKCILERVRFCLKGATIMVQRFRWTGGETNLQSWEDSDWAGYLQNQKCPQVV